MCNIFEVAKPNSVGYFVDKSFHWVKYLSLRSLLTFAINSLLLNLFLQDFPCSGDTNQFIRKKSTENRFSNRFFIRRRVYSVSCHVTNFPCHDMDVYILVWTFLHNIYIANPSAEGKNFFIKYNANKSSLSSLNYQTFILCPLCSKKVYIYGEKL